MPAIITHYTFAKEVMVDSSRAYPAALFLGAQGPDPFFFYGQIPWKKRPRAKAVNAYGVRIHHIDVTDLYESLLKHASASKDSELLMSYVEGLFLHYALDRNCHPYVFSKAGFSDDPKYAQVYSLSHMLLETYLDLIIGKRAKTFTYHAERYLKVPKEQLEAISALWSEANAEVTKDPSIDKTTFYSAAKDYEGILRFVNTPHALKRWFIGAFIGKQSQPFAMNYPSQIPPELRNLDYLNENHGEWPDPVSGGKRNESFLDLWNAAQRDYIAVLPLLQKARAHEAFHGELSAYIRNLDHDGFEPEEKMNFMDPLWPSIPGLEELEDTK
jgi:hypothetical protein